MTARESLPLGIAAALAPVLAVLTPLGLAPLLVVASVGTLTLRLMHHRDRTWHPKPLILLFVAFIGLCLASTIWSIAPDATLLKVVLLGGALACGAVLIDASSALDSEERRRIGRLLAAGLVVALALLFLELVAGFPIRHLQRASWPDRTALFVSYNRGATVLALLVWPAALTLSRQSRRNGILLVAATLGLLAFYHDGAAHVALAAGAVTFLLAVKWHRYVAIALMILMLAYTATAPLIHDRLVGASSVIATLESNHIDKDIVPSSGYQRLRIWHFTSGRILERPILGWGLESSRFIPGGTGFVAPGQQALPLHPHNGVLQIWLELGLAGIALFAGLIVWMLTSIRGASWPPPDKASSLALIIAAFVIVNLSFGLWQGWWVAALFFAATFAVGAMPATAARHREPGVAYSPVRMSADLKR